MRKHGYNKRRTWRKLHLGVDEKTGYIHAQVLTKNSKGDGDAQQVPQLLGQVKSPIKCFGGDGAYDTYEIWELLKEKEIEGIIPPATARKLAVIIWNMITKKIPYRSKEKYLFLDQKRKQLADLRKKIIKLDLDHDVFIRPEYREKWLLNQLGKQSVN